jgi:hypothetical protein
MQVLLTLAPIRLKGGPGSGHHGHRGRVGKVGGSLPKGISGVSKTPVSDEDKRLHEHIKTYADFIEKNHPKASSQESLVLKHGRFFTPSTEIPDWCEPGAMKECYHNSFNNILNMPDDVYYTEGFAFVEGMDFPFGHGWLTHADGTVIDPTWDDGVTYFGIRMNTNWVIKKVLKTEISGILPNDWMDENTIAINGFPPGALVDDDIVEKGGPGSGHFSHSGRPGKVGGSAPDKGGAGQGGPIMPLYHAPSHIVLGYKDDFTVGLIDYVNGNFDSEALHHYFPARWMRFRDHTNLSTPQEIRSWLMELEEIFVDDGTGKIWNVEFHPGSQAMHVKFQLFPDKEALSAIDLSVGNMLFGSFSIRPNNEIYFGGLDVQPILQDRDIVTNMFFNAAVSFSRMGYTSILTECNSTIGKYAWAKKGFTFLTTIDGGDWDSVNDKLAKWIEKQPSIDVDNDFRFIPRFDSIQDLANWDHGISLSGRDIDNDDVPGGMRLPLGKAFMLDDPWGGGGLGAWDGKLDLAPFKNLKGGVGSGHFDHAGRPGLVGGSAPDDGVIRISRSDSNRPVREPTGRESHPTWEDATTPGGHITLDRLNKLLDDEKRVLGQAFGIDDWSDENIDKLEKQLFDTFYLEDSEYYISIRAVETGPVLGAQINVEWRTGAGTAMERLTGTCEMTLTDAPGSRKVMWNLLDFRSSFTNRGEAGALFDKIENNLATNWNMDMITMHANITIGRYAWAKRGYDYSMLGQMDAASSKRHLWNWLVNTNMTKRIGIDFEDYLPDFKTANDFATWDPGGIRVKRNEIPGFENKAVPYELPMHLGKAFMLDEQGHGDWDAYKWIGGSNE